MRLLFVADGRSPTALNWIRYFVDRGDEVFLASTFGCQPGLKLAGLEIVPVAFSGVKSSQGASNKSHRGLWGASTLQLRTVIRQWLGPLTVSRAAGRLRGMIERIQPDLVHAMRIPYEGMLAADAAGLAPLLVSVWGNDFTLHASSTPFMRHYTEWTLKTADALHADCQRDIRLGKKWGFSVQKPTFVIPGSGGIRSDVFFQSSTAVQAPHVVNPRGFRAYVSNDVFFQAIPLVLKVRPDARFSCPTMAGEHQVLEWIDRLGIEAAVDLLPSCSQMELAALFRSAQVVVSPTTHDGSPNSLLEAMACGCFPVASDLDSIREWITPEKNGLLVDATNPQALAAAILRGLNEPALRKRAAEINETVIAERAEYGQGMARAADFYKKLTNSTI
ncbi:MAG: glycosyltransferase family 4 protein [Chloroflexi bacterium]|nr:glycosyltransferase family 4 protein [Chloroflexota bacterium]